MRPDGDRVTHVHPTGRFSVPRQRRSLLSRPRLLERLHAGIGNGVTVLHAPAGFGKTALIAAFCEELDFETRWLTLDGASCYPELLAEQIGTALAGEADGWQPASAVKAQDLKAYLASTTREAAAATDLPVLLVIDNVHELHDAPDAIDLLGWLMESVPEGWELILSGRTSPGLVEVDRRIAAGECLLLTASDLAFTVEEIGELVVRPPRAGLSAAKVAEATLGWPVGVMAVLNGMMNPDVPGAEQQRAAWERYLQAEVWQATPQDIRAQLVRLSMVGVIEPELAEVLLTPAGWRHLRAWLGANDFLFESLSGDAVRVNPLLRAFLLQELARSPEEVRELCLRTAIAWLEGRGMIHEAIDLAGEHGHGAALAGLVTRHGWPLLHQGAYAVLDRAFQAMPAEALDADTFLLSVRAHQLARSDRAQEALDLADTLLTRKDLPGNARMHAMLARIRAYRLLGERDKLSEMFEQIREVTPDDDPAIAAELAWQEAQGLIAISSDLPQAERLLKESMQHAAAGRVPIQELIARSSLGHLYAMRGDAPRAVNELTLAAQGWRQLRGSSNLGWVLNNLGIALQLGGDFESSIAVLNEAHAEAVACENARTEAYSTASLGDAEYALGHYERAKEHYEEAIRIAATEVLDESLAALSIAGLSASLLGLGDVQQAAFYGERALLIAETLGNPYEQGLCLMNMAVVESASRNHAGAVALMDHAIDLFRSIEAEASLRLAYYRLAMCQFAANRRAEAQQALQSLADLIGEPWTAGALLPAVKEQPLFAQWVAARNLAGPVFREVLERHAMLGDAGFERDEPASRFPRVAVKSLGATQVTVGERVVHEEGWASARAKELFFLFLANRNGLRKQQAVEMLSPELDRSKCNSVFHSNLYRLRHALYQESIVKIDGAYVLNPEGEFAWDVDEFERSLESARALPSGSDQRASALEAALQLYQGPFAEEFYAEWAEAVRARTTQGSLRALSSLAGYYAATGKFEDAAACLERSLALDALNEDTAFQLATCRARAGQASSALSFLDEFGRQLTGELGEDLPPRLAALRHQIAIGVAV